nr:sugar transferase [Oceaniglobus trochenteri]
MGLSGATSPKTDSGTIVSVFSPGLAFSARHNPVTPGGKLPGSLQYRALGKRLLDIILVLLSAPLTLVVVAICALALAIEGGSPFYRQDRLGVGGRRFSILKLRTMVRDADACLQRYLDADPAMAREWAETQKLKHDPRITRVGAFLRTTSLDELPQFWNVLVGDMSLVGPRPMMPEQLPLYGDPYAYFAMRPGITGYWQVSARNENHFSFRAEIDAQYHAKMSLPCDLGVMMRTVGVMLRRTGY